MTCRACKASSLVHLHCAFRNDGTFDPENWSCRTLHILRTEAQSGRNGCFHYRDDLAAGSIGVVNVPEGDEHSGFYVTLAWYKDRGKTDSAFFAGLLDKHGELTLDVAEMAVKAVLHGA